jgi:hypothetical protein
MEASTPRTEYSLRPDPASRTTKKPLSSLEVFILLDLPRR